MTRGRFFEDFRLGQTLQHATPRTVAEADTALYIALTGSRFAVNSSAPFARALGYRDPPLDDLLVFNIVFGKSVPDISVNAVANLGYAEGRFEAPVYAGDTLSASSTVLGLRETSNGRAGIVWVRTEGRNQRGEPVVSYVRWVMVEKRDPGSAAPTGSAPQLAPRVPAEAVLVPEWLDLRHYDFTAAGSAQRWGSYAPGERIDHVAGMTIEEAEHQMATRLYQNSAQVHFERHRMATTRFGRRLVYGGHIMSLARALSFEGLANAFRIVAIHGGRHIVPVAAGDTIYAWS
ncbi:MAG TPA: MaoC family dehydratase, partial [Alphaproteobacteria bacterium]|nr:MaoC family dehydratase [Alphaproteobacteria bacterium]